MPNQDPSSSALSPRSVQLPLETSHGTPQPKNWFICVAPDCQTAESWESTKPQGNEAEKLLLRATSAPPSLAASLSEHKPSA